MRSWSSRLLGIAILGAIAFGAVWFVARGSLGDRIVCPASIDAGTISREQNAEVPICIENRSEQTVRLTDFEASCGCMGLYYRVGPDSKRLVEARLAPREHLTAVLVLHPHGLSPTFSHIVRFRTDLPGSETKHVSVRGRVERGMYSVPETLHFGTLQSGETATKQLRLVDLRNPQQRSPIAVECNHDGVRLLELCEVSADAGEAPWDARVYEATFTITAPPQGPVQGRILVTASDGVRLHETPFYAHIIPRVRVVPSVVVLPQVGSAEPYVTKVICQALEGYQLKIDSVPEGFEANMKGGIVTIRCVDVSRIGSHVLTLSAVAPIEAAVSLTVTIRVTDVGTLLAK
jgi:hypothetical protein